jgi:hypothetical protein
MKILGKARARGFTVLAVALVLWCSLAGIPPRLLAGLPDIALASPKRMLSAGGAEENDGPASSIAVRCEVLMHFGRLMPEDAAIEQVRQLAQMFKAGATGDEEAIRALVKDFPPADTLLFDGEGYKGGNFGFIDAIIGAEGRPVALDRESPMFLVPLTAGAEETLAKKREAFQTRRNPRVLREIGVDPAPASDATAALSPAEMMFDDGAYLRPYCGRFDDLYFHLFQNGNAVSALAFSAVADGLSERRYHPLTGLVDQKIGPAERFNLNDILSGGGLSAIRAYVARSGAPETTAFSGFAYHVMPLLVKRVVAASPGDVLKVDTADVLKAMRGGERLYPTRVPPLYVSPDRFLGWAGSLCIPVVDTFSLPRESMDSYCPLPKQNPDDNETKPADGSASNRLFESSSTNELVWEDPQKSDLLSDSHDAKGRKSVPPASRTPKAKDRTTGFVTKPRPGDLIREDRKTDGSAPAVEPPRPTETPRRSMPPSRLIAVVTPTSAETAEYFSAIQSNDDRLRTAEQALGRMQRLKSELKHALSSLPRETGDDLPKAIADDLALLDRGEKDTRSELLSALTDRADVRAVLERRLIEERVAPLRLLGKKVEQGESGASPQ